MVVSDLSSKKKLLSKLKCLFPELVIEPGDAFYWQPHNKTIYTNFSEYSLLEYWSFIHEIGHAVLLHKSFGSDFELLQLEINAWNEAREITKRLKLKLDESYVQDCLDEYRDWLHQRSLCPVCNLTGVQLNSTTYRCIHCLNEWGVSRAHMCRPYRKNKKTPS